MRSQIHKTVACFANTIGDFLIPYPDAHGALSWLGILCNLWTNKTEHSWRLGVQIKGVHTNCNGVKNLL